MCACRCAIAAATSMCRTMRAGSGQSGRCRTRLTLQAWSIVPAQGEAAFYGPKADFIARDALGREWQLSTIQVDFIQPARLGLRVYRRGRPSAHAGDVAPRGDGLDRALSGPADRALRRRLPALAGARSGRDHPDRRPAHRLRTLGTTATARSAVCVRRSTTGRSG